MDLPVDTYLDGLFTTDAAEQPSDTVPQEELVLQLPPWYNEKKYNQGRKFYWDHCYALTTSMLMGLVVVFSIPSILKVLIGSHRSSSNYTAYKRYLSTILHTNSWFEYELKPGTKSWNSLQAVRTRHIRAGLSAKLHGQGTVSQRDIALTQFGFIGFTMLKPDAFGIRALEEGDWEAYNHFWRTICYMIGLDDRYNLCRRTVDETREVCQVILDRVFTPCMESVPEYFEHMATVMLDSLWSVNPTINVSAHLYFAKYLANVPGYVYTENQRIEFQKKLKAKLKDMPEDTGIESTSLIEPPLIEIQAKSPRLLYLRDYDVLEKIPTYKCLSGFQRNKLASIFGISFLCTTFIGRWYFKLNYLWSVILMKYCPYLAFPRFGVRSSYVDIFVEDPTDNAVPLPNAVYYKAKPEPWYYSWLSFLKKES